MFSRDNSIFVWILFVVIVAVNRKNFASTSCDCAVVATNNRNSTAEEQRIFCELVLTDNTQQEVKR